MTRRSSRAVRACLAMLLPALLLAGASVPPDLLSGLVWRNVGPFRGGRISAASGVIGDPGTFYVGLPQGGVWKTTSGGSTWWPVFDGVPGVSSIGALAVAPSNGNVIYAGTGDLFTNILYDRANGVYRSADAGATWTHLGLDSANRISAILVDPRNPNVVLVAAYGFTRKKNMMRGIFRSTDGGATWTHPFANSDTTAVSALAAAYDRPDVVYATANRWYVAPRGASAATTPGQSAMVGLGIFKSLDGGVTWTRLTGSTVPKWSGRTRIAVAQGTNAQRVYFVSNAGLYRSDDGGATWRQMAQDDHRIRNGQGGYNCGVLVDPKNPDVVYVFNQSAYKSTDGGATFTGFKGAPGGDDPQAGWIDPTDGRRILLGYDQGAIVSYDGGASWSSWYNQSTEQVYRLAVDKSFPYWIYATQQDAGAVRTRVRGDMGAITPFDWSGVNGWEWGTIAVDPLDNDIVYASGNGINRITMSSGQWTSVSAAFDPALKLREGLMEPILFAPWDPHELIAGTQFVMASTDGGMHWRKLSPDLTYPGGVTPPPDSAKPAPNSPRPGTIESISASPAEKGLIWAGTSNGLIKVTRDHGQHWQDVSAPAIKTLERPAVQFITASPLRAGTAYVTFTMDDSTSAYPPIVYRTRDYGASWTRITDGLPASALVEPIRADPKREGLVFVGLNNGVFVSFDDGDHWQSLQRNLPLAEVHDILVAGNDLIVGTYGRGIWVMDGASVLRQVTPEIANEPVHLFQPDTAVRVRKNVNFDTPLPPEVPQALNPPDGAILYYWLQSKPAGEITIDVLDASGAVIRHLSSVPAPQVKEAARPPFANFWVAAPPRLPADRGLNRANWDLRLDAPPALLHSFEINANPERTPPMPEAPLAPPGTYAVRLTVDGKQYTRSVVVVNDPRSRASAKDVAEQVAFQRAMMAAMGITRDGFMQAERMSVALDSIRIADSTSAAAKAVASFRAKLDSIEGDPDETRSYYNAEPDMPPSDFHGLNEWLALQLLAESYGDHAPTQPMRDGFAAACKTLASTAAKWQALNATDLPALAAELAKTGIKAPPPAAGVTAPKC